MSRFVWVDAGNDADWEKHARHQINGEYYAGTDSPIDIARRCSESRKRGHAAGVYTALNWWGGGEGEEYAERTHAILQAVEDHMRDLGLRPTNSFPKVQLDHESHEPDDILDMLRRWRELRPYKDTSWTFEGGQGGWMGPLFVAEVIRHRVRLTPQLYNGEMTEVWDALTFARDLTMRGFPDSLISPFYDAANLPVGWDGWAFTMGTLP